MKKGRTEVDPRTLNEIALAGRGYIIKVLEIGKEIRLVAEAVKVTGARSRYNAEPVAYPKAFRSLACIFQLSGHGGKANYNS